MMLSRWFAKPLHTWNRSVRSAGLPWSSPAASARRTAAAASASDTDKALRRTPTPLAPASEASADVDADPECCGLEDAEGEDSTAAALLLPLLLVTTELIAAPASVALLTDSEDAVAVALMALVTVLGLSAEEAGSRALLMGKRSALPAK